MLWICDFQKEPGALRAPGLSQSDMGCVTGAGAGWAAGQ